MHKSIRVLAIDDSPNDAEKMSSLIKAAGYGVQLKRTITEEEFQGKLKSFNPNLILYRLKSGIPSFPSVIDSIELSGIHVPVIAIADDPNPDTAACMAEGAVDRVMFSDTEHFKLVVKRTAQTFFQWQELISSKSDLIEAQQRCGSLMNTSKDAIAFIHEGMHIHANDAYLELFGFNVIDDIEALPIMDLIAATEQQNFKKFLREYNGSKNESSSLHTQILLPGDQPFSTVIEFTPARMEGEDCTQIIIRSSGSDSAEISAADYMTEFDISSGLYNRKFLLEKLAELHGNSESDEQPDAALILLGIDNYRDIQSTLGVIGADTLFNHVGAILRDDAEKTDIVARFDTSTFAIITENTDQLKENIEAFQQKVIDKIFEIEGKSTTCSISAGITTIDEHAPVADELISRASRSLEKAMQSRNSIKIYEPAQGELSQKQIDQQWDERLRTALKENRLQLVFQPIISLLGDNIERYNVFTQLKEQDGSIIPARDFMPSAERIGFAQGLDRWVLLKALKILSAEDMSDQEVVFFIKLTAGTLENPDDYDWYKQQILSHGIEPSKLAFEIKTDTLSNHIKAASGFSTLMHALGCKLVVDDFGSATDPFQLTKHLQPDFLKIGSDFSKDINTNEENRETVKNLIRQAHENKQEVIVQHIEDAQQLTTLWGLNTNYVQGNFLQAPSDSMEYDFGSSL